MNTFNERPLRQRDRQKLATRARILAAAREEFEALGFEDASVRGIAQRAKTSAASVLHHFGDKQQLLHAALYEALDAAIDQALEDAHQPATLEEQLDALARAVFAFYQARPALSRTLLRESLFACPPWAERFGSQLGRVHTCVARWVRESLARGEWALPEGEPLEGSLAPERAALAWCSFFYFALIAWVQGAVEDPAGQVARLTRQHLRGMQPPPPENARRPL